jgi:hypothetical protein
MLHADSVRILHNFKITLRQVQQHASHATVLDSSLMNRAIDV